MSLVKLTHIAVRDSLPHSRYNPLGPNDSSRYSHYVKQDVSYSDYPELTTSFDVLDDLQIVQPRSIKESPAVSSFPPRLTVCVYRRDGKMHTCVCFTLMSSKCGVRRWQGEVDGGKKCRKPICKVLMNQILYHASPSPYRNRGRRRCPVIFH
ncbi:hypothetical protein BGW80DRAFT_1307975 [Lactifluus volemus]|nr:hypothetical protein BGW80DRAFT_1307975 [Lactifluus volemus]